MKNNYISVAVCLCLFISKANTTFSQIQFQDCISEPSSLCVQDEGVRLPANNKFIIGESDPNATSCSVHLSQKTKVQAQCGNTVQYQVELITIEGATHLLKPPDSYMPDSSFHLCDFPNWGVEHLQEIWIADRGVDMNCNGSIEWNERNINNDQIILVIDDPGFIDCDPNNTVTISGKITTESEIEIANVYVNLISDIQPYPTYITDGNGEYVFEIIPDSTINIIPERLDNPKNGVSTLDIVQIMKHLLTKDTLDSPYKLIAADANNSQSVSVIDIVELRKLILGIYTDLPNNKSWRFVPKDYDFPNPFDPWEPDTAMNTALDFTFDGSQSAVYDFTGIKIGDVNGTVQAGVNSILPRQGNKLLQFLVTDNYFEAGEIVEINLSVDKDIFIQGFQLTVASQNLEFLSASSDLIDIGEDCYALFNDRMTFSWFDIDGKSLNTNDVVLTIKARSKDSGYLSESLQINSDITKAEAYSMNGEIYLPSLKLKELEKEVNIYPNPWNEETTISFPLAGEGNVLLEIFDLNGRAIYQQEKYYDKGDVAIEVNSQQVTGNGLYIFTIKTAGSCYSGKMCIED